MTLLDENISDDQWTEMEKAGLPVHKAGRDWGRKGLSDEDILAELRSLRRVTFLTQDADFYRRENCHPEYCIALLAVERRDVAQYARRFLKHPSFRTHAKRAGKVVRVQPTGTVYWQRNAAREVETSWS